MKKILLSLMLVLISLPANAVLHIDINRGNIDPIPIALPAPGSSEPEAALIGNDIVGVIQADLERSGLFRYISKDAYIQQITNHETQPEFLGWRGINASALFAGDIKMQGKEEFSITFRLWDVLSQQSMTGMSFTTDTRNWRRIAHIIADEIYSRITGEQGYFDTRIVYVSEHGSELHRTKRIAIMDQDGANQRFLTGGADLVLTPRFSPNLQKIIYMSYKNNNPRVYIQDVDTGETELVGHFPGMSFAPRFAPDGKSVIMSASLDGNSEIFTMNLKTKKMTRLTNDPAIDTSPSYSPDGKQIVFNSDRGGTQQLYVMNSNGSNVQRISFSDKGRYATPVWSPRGDLIAFTKMYQGKFYIGVMYPDGSGERLLTESFMDEGPTWSPNGRVIMFARQTKSYVSNGNSRWNIYSIDLTGYNERLVKTSEDASDPAWSPIVTVE